MTGSSLSCPSASARAHGDLFAHPVVDQILELIVGSAHAARSFQSRGEVARRSAVTTMFLPDPAASIAQARAATMIARAQQEETQEWFWKDRFMGCGTETKET